MLLAAGNGIAIVIDALKGDGSDPLAVADLETGASRNLGTMSSLGIDDNGREAGAVSPDGSQVAIGSSHKIVLIQLASGSERTLLATRDSSTWFMPLRWTAAGLLVGEVGYEGVGYSQLSIVDVQTGQRTSVSGPVRVLSPDGRWQVSAENVDLGDGFADRGGWSNTLYLSHVGGSTTRIISEPYRNFTPLDVTDDGRVLFDSDTSSSRAVTADMGLYLATNGHPVQQLHEAFRLEFDPYGSAKFLDPSTALVPRIRWGSLTMKRVLTSS